MQNTIDAVDHEQYARCIAASKRVRWDIDRDVIRGRRFDREQPNFYNLSRTVALNPKLVVE